MAALYKITDWLWFVLTGFLLAVVISVNFESYQDRLNNVHFAEAGWNAVYVEGAIVIWIIMSLVLIPLIFLFKRYVPEQERASLNNKKAKYIVAGIIFLLAVTQITINWFY
jgi:hypothetical protein